MRSDVLGPGAANPSPHRGDELRTKCAKSRARGKGGKEYISRLTSSLPPRSGPPSFHRTRDGELYRWLCARAVRNPDRLLLLPSRLHLCASCRIQHRHLRLSGSGRRRFILCWNSLRHLAIPRAHPPYQSSRSRERRPSATSPCLLPFSSPKV